MRQWKGSKYNIQYWARPEQASAFKKKTKFWVCRTYTVGSACYIIMLLYNRCNTTRTTIRNFLLGDRFDSKSPDDARDRNFIV